MGLFSAVKARRAPTLLPQAVRQAGGQPRGCAPIQCACDIALHFNVALSDSIAAFVGADSVR
jgi:hypothetical protein